MITLSLDPYGQGVHKDIPFADYQKIKAVNKSSLALVKDSPEDCLASLEGRYHRDSAGFAIGSALDDLLTMNMTPEAWNAAHPQASTCQAILASGKRKGHPCGCQTLNKFGDEWLCGTHGKGEPTMTASLTADDMDAINGMAKSLLESDTAPLFKAMKASQLTCLWIDEETGLPCKARLDGVSVCQLPGFDGPGSVRWDLKTTKATNPHEFIKDANKFAYFLQDAHYSSGAATLAKAQGKEVIDIPFIFAVACNTPSSPLGRHTSFLWEYDAQARASAESERAHLMRKLKACFDSGNFPPKRVKGIQSGSVPDYMFSHLQESP